MQKPSRPATETLALAAIIIMFFIIIARNKPAKRVMRRAGRKLKKAM